MPTRVQAAARRLRGHLIDTPLIGEIRLPGFAVGTGVRVKAECVQTAGSAWYRGYLHYLLRSFGRFKGLVLHGDDAMVRAQACAGAFHRLPMVAECDVDPLRELGLEVERDPSGADGFHRLPGADDAAVAEGLATLGLELADQLPSDVTRVVLATGAFATPVREGFGAAGRACEVVATAPSTFPPEWPDAVARGMRVLPDAAALDALWQERERAVPTCVVV